MAIKDIITRTAKALTGSPTADELRAVLREARQRLTEVEGRIEATREGGAEHTRVLREGSTDALIKLEAEHKTLLAEVKQLRARVKELNDKERRARAKEAVAEAKNLKAALVKAAEDAEDAQRAYERAKAATEKQVRAIREAVRGCKREDIDPTPLLLDQGAIERAAALLDTPGKTQAQVAHELRRDIGDRSKPKPHQGDAVTGALVKEG